MASQIPALPPTPLWQENADAQGLVDAGLGGTAFLGVVMSLAATQSGLRLQRVLEAPTNKPAARPIATPADRFVEAWERNVRVEVLEVGNQIRGRAFASTRQIISIKPHPKAGVVVKTLPTHPWRNTAGPSQGKVLQHHLTGHIDRWDGITHVEWSR